MLPFVKSVFYKKRLGVLATVVFVLAALSLVSGKFAESYTTTVKAENAGQMSDKAKENPAFISSEQQFIRQTGQPFIGAVNGEAFVFEENPIGKRIISLKTSKPVFKAFGLSADGRKILYSSLRGGAPSGELFLEDLETGSGVKVTSRLVLSAAFSPAGDDRIALTYADGAKFGLAVIEPGAKRERILAAENVFTEIFEWDESGKGIHYFETAIEASSLSLNPQYAAVDATASRELFLPTMPAGFPELAGKTNSILKTELFKKADETEESDFAFRIKAPDGVHEISGDNLLGPTRLAVRYNNSGRTRAFADGQLVRVLSSGVVLKQFSREGTSLRFVDWNGKAETLGLTTVNYHLPASSSVMVF